MDSQPRPLIAHLDLDCFFVSVERIDDPSLRGKPVAVGGSATGRGVIASASYEARKFGVRSAMPTGQALRKCPGLIVVSGRHNRYGEYSQKVYEYLLSVAPKVERASIDEMYLDLTGCEGLYRNDLAGFIKKVQSDVRKLFDLPCTIALASNKMVAKIATTKNKPKGCAVIRAGSEAAWLAPLPIESIPGVGDKTAVVLHRHGITTVGDCQKRSERELADSFGSFGSYLFRAVQGRGSVSVAETRERKSISKEETFSHDLTDRAELEKTLFSLVESICWTLRKKGLKATTVTLKLRDKDFTTTVRRVSCPPTDYDPAVYESAVALFRKFFRSSVPVRLLGVGVAGLQASDEDDIDLFSKPGGTTPIVEAVDKLRAKYGSEIIHIGGGGERPAGHKNILKGKQ
jgi:DNA polymerase-4